MRSCLACFTWRKRQDIRIRFKYKQGKTARNGCKILSWGINQFIFGETFQVLCKQELHSSLGVVFELVFSVAI